MNYAERVDEAPEGRHVDRPPYTMYRTIEHSTPEVESRAYLRFQESFNTNIVMVANPNPFPASSSELIWKTFASKPSIRKPLEVRGPHRLEFP